MSFTVKRCQAIQEKHVPVGAYRKLYGPRFTSTPVEGILQEVRQSDRECVAVLSSSVPDFHVSWYSDERKVKKAEGELVIHLPQKHPITRDIIKGFNRPSGCRFTEFHSYTVSEFEYDQPRSPDNHVHFECRGPYEPSEWRGALSQLINTAMKAADYA